MHSIALYRQVRGNILRLAVDKAMLAAVAAAAAVAGLILGPTAVAGLILVLTAVAAVAAVVSDLPNLLHLHLRSTFLSPLLDHTVALCLE